MPELRLVVLALQDRLAYGTTFEAALSSLFNGTDSSITAIAAQSGSVPQNGTSDASVPMLSASQPTNRSADIQQAALEFKPTTKGLRHRANSPRQAPS